MSTHRIVLKCGLVAFVLAFAVSLVWLPTGRMWPRNMIAALVVAPFAFTILACFAVPKIVTDRYFFHKKKTSFALGLASLKFYWRGIVGLILLLSVLVAVLIAAAPSEWGSATVR